MGVSKATEFTSTGTYTADTSLVLVTMVPGGGGGGPGRSTHGSGSGGGGAGEQCVRRPVKLTIGEMVTVTIGAAGNGGTFDSGNGGNGTDSSFGTYVVVRAGLGGQGCENINAFDVGSGGGCSGGVIGGTPNDIPAVEGTGETNRHFGGASGAGSVISAMLLYMPGANCGPNAGGAPGFNGSQSRGGAGGGAGLYGPGGDGGAGSNSLGPSGYGINGHQPPAGSYGAGGGGSSGGIASRIGGVGRDGYCLVERIV